MADDRTAAATEAIDLLRRALALMDAHDFGTGAAPHVDLGLHMLRVEVAALDQPGDDW